MKKTKTIFWIATILIFLFEGALPALTSQTKPAQEVIRQLGYPQYFGNALVIFKAIGSIVLIIPQIPDRFKEWAYAGFAFDFIFACISHWAVRGFGIYPIVPLIALAILIVSYICHHKMKAEQYLAQRT